MTFATKGSKWKGSKWKGSLWKGSLFGADGSVMMLSYYLPLLDSLFPSFGNPNPSFSRASSGTVTDFEGNSLNTLSGEARFNGARRVHNLLTGNTNSLATQTVTVSVGEEYVLYFEGTGSITLSGAATGTISSETVTIIAALTTSLILTVSGSVSSARLYSTEDTEYVSNGVSSSPLYHGASVDGVQYFDTDRDGKQINPEGLFLETADSLSISNSGGFLSSSFSLILTVTSKTSGSTLTDNDIRIFGTEDTSGNNKEVRTIGGSDYGYNAIPQGGAEFVIKKDDLNADWETKFAFQVIQKESEVSVKIAKDGFIVHSETVTQTLDHSDTSLTIGKWESNNFEGSYKNLRVYQSELSESHLKDFTTSIYLQDETGDIITDENGNPIEAG